MGTSVLGIIDGLLGTNHPHACGDKCQYPHCREPSLGSSPRVWGQGFIKERMRRYFRIIPTRVGTSSALWEVTSTTGGSSPRVWGQGHTEFFLHICQWIIPTRVGTSTISDGGITPFEDHPHACGDNIVYTVTFRPMKGSSPRVWGQAPILTNNSNKFRIIPTRVGTSSVNFPIVHLSFHHPHACGDKFIRFPFPFRWRGSSPRVWGQV